MGQHICYGVAQHNNWCGFPPFVRSCVNKSLFLHYLLFDKFLFFWRNLDVKMSHVSLPYFFMLTYQNWRVKCGSYRHFSKSAKSFEAKYNDTLICLVQFLGKIFFGQKSFLPIMHTKSSAHFLWMVLFTTAMQECKNEFAHSAAASRFDIDLPYKMGKSSWNTLYLCIVVHVRVVIQLSEQQWSHDCASFTKSRSHRMQIGR